MQRPKVDYDRIAAGYDRRFVDGGTRGVAAALQALAGDLGAGRILEAGCGTGHWLESLSRSNFDSRGRPHAAGPGPSSLRLYGLDLSAGMRPGREAALP